MEATDVMTACPARRRARVTLAACLSRYVDATALLRTEEKCYRCPDGSLRLAAYAAGRRTEDVAAIVAGGDGR